MVVERRCINLYSDMNPWMNLVLLVNDEVQYIHYLLYPINISVKKLLMIFGMIQKLKKNVGAMVIGLDGN